MVAPRRHAASVIPSEAAALELLGANLLQHLIVANRRGSHRIAQLIAHGGNA